MLEDYFVFDGVSSRDLGIVLQEAVGIEGAVANVTKKTIPGRNGVLHFYDGSYGNRTMEAKCYVLQEKATVALDQINRWLFQTPGYRRLELSTEPDFYRMARISTGPDVDIRANLLAPFKLKFDSMPQKFMTSGEITTTITGMMSLYNSGFTSKPLITVYGSGAGVLTVGGTSVQIKSIDQYVTLDCELQDAYKGVENKNSTIYALEFPTLPPGDVLITWTGGITKVEITPRWWML